MRGVSRDGEIRAQTGGIAAGRDVIARFLVTGDRNIFFSGSYQPLEEAYIDPWQVFERVRLDRFVGREWLERELDAFLLGSDRGYFIIEAKAGLGKTAFLAQLVRRRGWIHHFVDQAPGAEGVIPARKSLAAQILRTFELDYEHGAAALPDQAASRPDFLATLLRDAAAQRSAGERIVVVVDGLDEAGTRPGENVLGLPRVLPEGVFFVCSTRPAPIDLHVENRRSPVIIEPEGKENRDDLRAYLAGVALSGTVRRALDAQHYEVSHFVDALAARSSGVWIYLHYVVMEIEQGQRTVDFDALPDGLWDYYYEFWRRWKNAHASQWRTEHLPLLATLATVQSGVTLELLREFAGLEEIQTELPERWLPFLSVERASERHYRLYHKSLEDFLQLKVESAAHGEVASDFADELTSATHSAHGRIVDYYLNIWGGIEAGLPGLAAIDTRDLAGRYGLQHLVHHMLSSPEADARRLLALEQTESGRAVGNVWFAVHDEVDDIAGYLSDIGLGWQSANSVTLEQIRRGERTSGAALEYGYALLNSRVNALARRIPSALRVALLRHGMWSLQRAIADAKQLPPVDSVIALGGLARGLAGTEAGDVIQEALRILAAIGDEEDWLRALVGLAPNLSDALLTEILEKTRTLTDATPAEKTWRWMVLSVLVTHLPERFVEEAFAIARAKTDEYARSQVLAALALRLPDALVQEALEMTQAIDSQISRARVLAQLAPRLSEHDREAALVSVIDAVLENEPEPLTSPEEVIAEELADLARVLPDGLLGRMLEVVRGFGDESSRAMLLAALAPRLPRELAREALEMVQTGITDRQRVMVSAELIVRLPESEWESKFAEALRVARAIDSEMLRALTFTELAPKLPERYRKAVFAEAFEATRASTPEYLRAQVLEKLASRVPEEQMREVIELAREVGDETFRARVLASLARGAPEWLMGEMLEMTQAIGGEASRTMVLAELAPRLPRELMNKGLEVARASGHESPHALMLAELALRLPEAQRAAALADARDVALAITGESSRDSTLHKIALLVPDDLIGNALQMTRAITGESTRARALRDLASRLPRELMGEVLRVSDGILDERARAGVLEELVACVPEELMGEVLEKARAITDESSRASVLAKLAPRLPVELARESLEDALGMADGYLRGVALAEIARKLPAEEREVALAQFNASARTIVDDSSLEEMFVGVTCLLSWETDEIPSEVSEVVLPTVNQSYHASMLAEMASHLPEPERTTKLEQALTLARGIPVAALRASALADLTPHLSDAQRQVAWADALATARTTADESDRVRVLVELTPKLPRELVDETFDAARSIADESSRVRLLVALAPRLPGELAQEALELARLVAYEPARAELLAGLAPALPDERVGEAFEMVSSITHGWARCWALCPLAPRLPEELMDDALELVRTAADADNGPAALAALVPHIPRRLVGDALEMTREITNYFSLASVLRALVPRLSEEQLGEALDLTRSITEDSFRMGLLNDLAVVLMDSGGVELHRVWTELLATTGGRADTTLLASATVFDAIAALGGEDAICDARQWVNRVWRWWP